MQKPVEILVTLSTFGAGSEEPRRLLRQSGFAFKINDSGKRMDPADIVAQGHDCLSLIAGVEKYSAETLAQLPALRCISRCGAGIDSIDLAAAKMRGIAVLNTPDEPTGAVAELTLTMILALLRQLPKVDALTHAAKWQRITGHLLAGKIVGIIGLGRIGRRVAEITKAFGAHVIATEPYPDTTWVDAHSVELVDFPTLLARADIVSIHASHMPGKTMRIGATELAQMKPEALLVNVARGDMVDDAALFDALSSGRLGGAALDVFPNEPYSGPLLHSDRVILSPHQATLTVETRVAMERRAVENALRYLQTEK
jgi:D-3-phosphoglycerate dehydrogenase / 2-oxoglutarate reductase